MPVDLFTILDLYDRAVGSAIHILGKGAEHAAKTGASDADMLGWRLIDDMHPLAFQLRVLANFTRQWPARVAGLEIPPDAPEPTDVAGWTGVLEEARRYLAGLTREQFAGRDDVPITFKMGNGMEPTLPGGQWLTVFALMNIEFHLSMAYAILRARGVPIGKIDLFAGRL